MNPKLKILMSESDKQLKNPRFVKTRKALKWLKVIIYGLTYGVIFLIAAYGIGSRLDPSLHELKFQSPFQNPLRFEVKEKTVRAIRPPKAAVIPAVSAETTPRIVANAQPVANDPKAQGRAK